MQAERFLSKVYFTDKCWLWMASFDGKGYGQFVYKGKLNRAHRVSYWLFKGKIPDGMDLDHLCREPKCVNPEHLEPVTRSTNLLRGLLWQSKKTHCPRGHEYDLSVKDYKGRIVRRCSICVKYFGNLRQKRYYERKKSAQSSMHSR